MFLRRFSPRLPVLTDRLSRRSLSFGPLSANISLSLYLPNVGRRERPNIFPPFASPFVPFVSPHLLAHSRSRRFFLGALAAHYAELCIEPIVRSFGGRISFELSSAGGDRAVNDSPHGIADAVIDRARKFAPSPRARGIARSAIFSTSGRGSTIRGRRGCVTR